MTTAASQLNRIVQLVAELSRQAGATDEGIALADLARHLGTTPAQIQRDVRTLTAASDHPDGDWLQSLSAWQEGDRVGVSSQGPFRRPVRLTPDELLAIRVGLALEAGKGEGVLARLTGLDRDGRSPAPAPRSAPDGPRGEAAVVDLAHEAIRASRVVTILYAGERNPAGSVRAVEPHQVVQAHGHWYIVAWCRRAQGWRHFRADRVLDAMTEPETFMMREDAVPVVLPEEVFRTGGVEPDEVRVRFAPSVARWIAERTPDAVRLPDGAVEVTFKVAEPKWLARHILQYGAEAEVVGPPLYRAMMRRLLSAG